MEKDIYVGYKMIQVADKYSYAFKYIVTNVSYMTQNTW